MTSDNDSCDCALLEWFDLYAYIVQDRQTLLYFKSYEDVHDTTSFVVYGIRSLVTRHNVLSRPYRCCCYPIFGESAMESWTSCG